MYFVLRSQDEDKGILRIRLKVSDGDFKIVNG